MVSARSDKRVVIHHSKKDSKADKSSPFVQAKSHRPKSSIASSRKDSKSGDIVMSFAQRITSSRQSLH